MAELFEKHDESRSGASFSPCRAYRYLLWRRWGDDDPASQAVFIGLNPSTADERENDPSIRRCIGFARGWGYDGVLMLNAYAFRATRPPEMLAAADPVGPGNDQVLRHCCGLAGRVVAAWGAHCEPSRAEELRRLLAPYNVSCLGVNKNGSPKHPLYLRSDSQPVRYHFTTTRPPGGKE